MKIEWHIGTDDIARVKELIRKRSNNAFVRRRMARNLAQLKPHVEREKFWFQMVGMRLTSVQRSGPESHVARFIRTVSFPLAYELVCGEADMEEFIGYALKTAGGIRFGETIAFQLAANLHRLEEGEWTTALQQCNRLTQPVTPTTEKEVADYIDDTFDGFGPKQSRNLLQALGLTLYEIPIDRRSSR